MTEILLAGLARANVAAAVAVILVLVLRGPTRKAFGARAAYGLWTLPLLAAGAVLAPHPQIVTPLSPMVLSAAAAADEFVASAATAGAAGPDLASLLLGAWIAGVVLMAGLLAQRQAAFVGSLGRLEKMSGRLFRAEQAGVGPAVVGVLRPRIVAPADFETLYGEAERGLILAHERAHLRTGDAGVNALVCAIQCLGWFNPLAHVAAHLLRVDQELACDAAVIAAFPGERKTYAELLLKTQLFTQPLPLGCHWPAGAEHPLKERIAMLKSPLPAPARRAVGLACVAALSATGAAAAWAAQPGAPGAKPAAVAQPESKPAPKPVVRTAASPAAAPSAVALITQPVWIKRPDGDDIAGLYPAGAAQLGLSAQVVMTCRIAVDGRLSACGLTRVDISGDKLPEPGADPDFGAATLKLAKLFQMEARSRDGQATAGGTIRIPVRWTPPQSPAASLNPAPIIKSAWLDKPTSADLARFYPPAAAKQNFEGVTSLSCSVGKDGRLSDCAAAGPTGFGAPDAIRDEFREATLKLAGFFRMQPQAAAGRVVIPIRWSLPTDPEAAAKFAALK